MESTVGRHKIRHLVAAVIFAVAVAAPHLADAAGAWMLWVYTNGGLASPTGEWRVLEEYQRLSDCRNEVSVNAQAKRESYLSIRGDAAFNVVTNGSPWDPKRPSLTPEEARAEARRETDSFITVRDGYFEMKTRRGKPLVFDYVCLPDTVQK